MTRERVREALRRYKAAAMAHASGEEQTAWLDEQKRLAGWQGGGN